MNAEIQTLKQQVAELQQQMNETDDLVLGVQKLFAEVLPFVLRDHPQADKVAGLLCQAAERYDELQEHPERAEPGDPSATVYEPAKTLYRQLAIMGVWPGVDNQNAALQAVMRR